MTPHLRAQKGATAMELLVVGAVVAILLALLLPLLGFVRARAAESRCVQNLRQLIAGVNLYAAEHGGFFPQSSLAGDGTSSSRLWYQLMQDRLPYDRKGVLPNENASNRPDVLTVYNCPVNPYRTDEWKTPSYAYNSALGKDERRVAVASLPYPAHTLVFVDAGIRREGTRPLTAGPPKILCYLTSPSGTFGWEKSVNFELHSGRANVAMADGHVESLRRVEVERRIAEETLHWAPDHKAGNYW